MLLGINTGGFCNVEGYAKYNKDACANYGIFLDKDFYSALARVLSRTGGSLYSPPLFKDATGI
jgi:hypothetical protein